VNSAKSKAGVPRHWWNYSAEQRGAHARASGEEGRGTWSTPDFERFANRSPETNGWPKTAYLPTLQPNFQSACTALSDLGKIFLFLLRDLSAFFAGLGESYCDRLLSALNSLAPLPDLSFPRFCL
jgi:hypothetical protein